MDLSSSPTNTYDDDSSRARKRRRRSSSREGASALQQEDHSDDGASSIRNRGESKGSTGDDSLDKVVVKKEREERWIEVEVQYHESPSAPLPETEPDRDELEESSSVPQASLSGEEQVPLANGASHSSDTSILASGTALLGTGSVVSHAQQAIAGSEAAGSLAPSPSTDRTVLPQRQRADASRRWSLWTPTSEHSLIFYVAQDPALLRWANGGAHSGLMQALQHFSDLTQGPTAVEIHRLLCSWRDTHAAFVMSLSRVARTTRCSSWKIEKDRDWLHTCLAQEESGWLLVYHDEIAVRYYNELIAAVMAGPAGPAAAAMAVRPQVTADVAAPAPITAPAHVATHTPSVAQPVAPAPNALSNSPTLNYGTSQAISTLPTMHRLPLPPLQPASPELPARPSPSHSVPHSRSLSNSFIQPLSTSAVPSPGATRPAVTRAEFEAQATLIAELQARIDRQAQLLAQQDGYIIKQAELLHSHAKMAHEHAQTIETLTGQVKTLGALLGQRFT